MEIPRKMAGAPSPYPAPGGVEVLEASVRIHPSTGVHPRPVGTTTAVASAPVHAPPDQAMLPRSDLEAAHLHSIRHRAEIEASERCGCFYCLATFAPAEIEEWIDAPPGIPAEEASGLTALCPRCGIDSVIGSAGGFPLTREFLARMEARWFGFRGLPDPIAPAKGSRG